MPLDATQVHAYYRAALAALAFVERARPSGRRFGPDADARWAAVRGGLTTGDRIDLLLRDASAEWPGSVGARAAFDFGSVAEDDAFGRDWPGLDGVTSERFYRDAAAMTLAAIADAVRAMAAAWSVTLSPVDRAAVDPRARFVAAGTSSVAALISAFSATPDTRWTTQVVVVSDTPVSRQLASTAAALLNHPGTALVLRSTDALPQAFAAAHVVVSADASPAEATRARSLRG